MCFGTKFPLQHIFKFFILIMNIKCIYPSKKCSISVMKS